MFNSLKLNEKPNQDFLKFISVQDDKKNYKNLELLLNLEKKYTGIFAKVMQNFDKVKERRETLNEKGLPIRVPWEKALEEYCINEKYVGITKDNEDIAELFAQKNLDQSIFDKAVILREKAIRSGVKEHMLGYSLKEETIKESLERIKKQSQNELINGNQLIDELYDKQFTYEWLSKRDPHNAIIGLYTNCCCTIKGITYGKKIAEATVSASDVQNLVIRDINGNIIAKGAVYVNKKDGYAVINDFELSKLYKNHESSVGIYDVSEDDKEEQDRELIFKQFQKGLLDFVEAYNKQNIKNPLKQINVGMGHNRLKRQVERFKKATSNLKVPFEYGFGDAFPEQYILYQANDKKTNLKKRKSDIDILEI